MEPTNGSHVSWRELNLALDPIKAQLTRIEARLALDEQEAWLGLRGRTVVQNIFTGFLIATLAACVSLLVAFLH